MGFFDLDEFTQAAEDSTIIPHPLAEKLSLAAKTSYLGMVVFASLVDDGKLTPDEQKAMRKTGLALQLPESDFDDIVGTVTGLKTNPEKMAFVKESLPALSERDTAMFLYCDMVGAMTADGELSDDAKAFLSGMAKFLKITGKDLDFLNEYTVFFPGKKPEAADVVFKYAAQNLPDGLISYFTPVLNPVRIPGGQLPLGDNKFCDGRFLIDSKVIVGTGVKLLVKNAEIEFGINGWIEIEDGDAEFIDSKFTAMEGQTENKADKTPVYLIKSSATKLLFSGCSFDGKMTRAAITQDYDLTMRDCRFNKLNGSDSCCVFGRDVVCIRCNFDNCSGNYFILKSLEDITICKTEFILCSANYIVSGSKLVQTVVLYKKCKSGIYVWDFSDKSQLGILCYIDCVGSVRSSSHVDYETWKKHFEEGQFEEEDMG